jgi:hypothetical protein
MALTVTIADNTLAISDTGVAATFNGSELLHPSYIAEVDQLTDGVALTPAPSAEGVVSNYAGNVVNYVVVLRFSDSKHQPLEIRLADVTNQPGWPNTQLGAIQAVTDIAAIMVLTGGGGGGGLTDITGIAGITYAGTPTSVMTVSNAPDAREALGATINHGPYVAGLVVNFHDLTYENGVVYEWLGSQFTTTGVIATDLNWSEWGSVWQKRARELLQLFDTDAVDLDPKVDIYYITDAAGEADIADLGTADFGAQFTITVDPGSTFIKFTPVGTVDGVASALNVGAGSHVQLTTTGSGNWITTG